VNRPFPGATASYNVNSFKAQVQLVSYNGVARGSVIDATDFMPFADRVDVAGLTMGGFVVASTRTQSIDRSIFYT